MHYSNIVIVDMEDKEENDGIEEVIEQIMAPGRDDWWNWYQIGGRWTGHFDGYDPDTDPALLETCQTCSGTGTRVDMVVENGCNGCQGAGQRRRWPTSSPLRKEDAIPVSALTEKHMKVHRVVIEGYGAFDSEMYVPWEEKVEDRFQKRELPPLEWIKKEFPKSIAVIVDNHN